MSIRVNCNEDDTFSACHLAIWSNIELLTLGMDGAMVGSPKFKKKKKFIIIIIYI